MTKACHIRQSLPPKVCLVGRIIGRMENFGWKMGWKTVFSTVWEAKENWDGWKMGWIIFHPGPQLFSSQIGRKTVGEKTFSLCNYWTALSQRLQIHQQHTHIHQQHTHIKPRKSTAHPYSSNPYKNSSNPYTNSYK